MPIPAGSTAIKGLYQSYYTLIGKPYDHTQFSGRSDYQAFIEAGIPSGGLFTGAEQVKTRRRPSGAAPPASSSIPGASMDRGLG